MDRHQTVAAFWNWLPAFRTVAETEHLPTAAERAHVTPAALSRTVKLLEEALERPLFLRRGRRLHLNDDGRTILRATRRAMRLVHDAMNEVGGRGLAGPIRVAAGGVGQVYATEALLRARETLPGLRPQLFTPDPGQAAQQLLRGDLDLVVGSFRLDHADLTTTLLGYATSGVYCGSQHALHGVETITLDEVQRHPFAAPPNRMDGWPAELERAVHFVTDRMATGVEVCGSTDLLAVIPDVVAHKSEQDLHRLPLRGLISKTPVLAARRETIGSQNLTERVLELLIDACETLDQAPA